MDMLDTCFEPIKLDEDTVITIEAIDLGGQREVSSEILDFSEVTGVIGKISEILVKPLKKAGPKKATVEFGLAVGLESGKLTALWVKGHGTAHLNIKLEWENM